MGTRALTILNHITVKNGDRPGTRFELRCYLPGDAEGTVVATEFGQYLLMSLQFRQKTGFATPSLQWIPIQHGTRSDYIRQRILILKNHKKFCRDGNNTYLAVTIAPHT